MMRNVGRFFTKIQGLIDKLPLIPASKYKSKDYHAHRYCRTKKPTETSVKATVNLDGKGVYKVTTGIGFFRPYEWSSSPATA